MTPTYIVEIDDPDPLPNDVSVLCSIAGFPNSFDVGDSHEVDLVHPSFTVMKSCVAEPIPAGTYANFFVDIANTGDYPLPINVDDPALLYNADFDLPVAPGPCTTLDFEAGNVDGQCGCSDEEDHQNGNPDRREPSIAVESSPVSH